jgi:hypothetical protein
MSTSVPGLFGPTAWHYDAAWRTKPPRRVYMKLVRWTATGIGLGVFSGFMGGLLRSRSVSDPALRSYLRKA